MGIDLSASYEDIELSLHNYTELEEFIQTSFIKPKTHTRNDSEDFQNAITRVMMHIDKILRFIDHLEQEDGEDSEKNSINIVKLKYYNLHYFKHILAMKKQAVITTDDKEELKKLQNMKNLFRAKFLIESNIYGLEYLEKLSKNNIIQGKKSSNLAMVKKIFQDNENIKNIDYKKAKDVWNELFPNDRDAKMANYKFKKMITQQVDEFEFQLKKKIPELFDSSVDPEEHESILDRLDDEVKVQYHMLLVLHLQKNSVQCISNVDANIQEIEILIQFLTEEAIDNFYKEKDEYQQKNETNYNKEDKLDTQVITPQNINRIYGKNYANVNFDLKNEQVSKLKNMVKGFGQYAPTQSLDELLEEELNQGRFTTQDGKKLTFDDIKDGDYFKKQALQEKKNNNVDSLRLTEEEVNEDNYDYLDQKTYEARYWDNFKESVTKGSGNMGRRRG
ncbi:hypothetical protein FOG51_04011 [Hanseniaspora uvarum]|nr:hypothetical protein FOG51_04011 [Hanseniaspora uvarum]